MRTPLLLVAAFALSACSQDLILQELPDGADSPGNLPEEQPPVDGGSDVVDDGTTDPVDDSTTDPVDDTGTDPVDPSPADPPPADDCAETTDLVYVIDRADEAIYTFDPETAQFAFVGALDCGMFEGTPASMAVGRDGVAWVRYSSNTLFAVDLATMDCTPTSMGSGFGSYGMGFATENAETWRDELFLANRNQLARLDPMTGGLENLGALPSQSELTGNAAGELWAFLPLEMPARLVRLDKQTAAPVEGYSLPAFTTADLDTFAFATWGEDFYLFMRFYGMGNSTDVYKVDANGTMTLLAGDTGMDVVGAGVSTCAPS
ncbi:MAG: hypothetical protein EP330_23450 [Deltaproteobacteria bacterium]|nr:MAG: hypothetical protein EP330_23450 [Deltaproteobacteria bacterium]